MRKRSICSLNRCLGTSVTTQLQCKNMIRGGNFCFKHLSKESEEESETSTRVETKAQDMWTAAWAPFSSGSSITTVVGQEETLSSTLATICSEEDAVPHPASIGNGKENDCSC